MFKKFIVNKDYHNSRFDRWFKQIVLNIPQSLLEKLIRKKKIKVNKKKTKTSYRVQINDKFEIQSYVLTEYNEKEGNNYLYSLVSL